MSDGFLIGLSAAASIACLIAAIAVVRRVIYVSGE